MSAKVVKTSALRLARPSLSAGARLDLAPQDPLQLGQLAVAVDGDTAGAATQRLEDAPVLAQILAPAVDVEFFEAVAPAAADGEFLVLVILVGTDFDLAGRAALAPRLDAAIQVVHLVEDAVHGQREGMDGAFQTLQQVDAHHADQPALAVALIEAQPLLFRVQIGRVLQVLRRHVDGQPEVADPVVQFVVGKLALAVRRRVQVLRLRTFREAADRRRHFGIEAADVIARAGDGDRIQQREEIGPQPFEQSRLVRRRPGPARGLPLLELALGHAEHRLDVADAQRVPERVLPPFGHQVDLVPQIA